MTNQFKAKLHRGMTAGFTLIEVLIVLLLFTVVAMGTTAMTIQSTRANAVNKLRTKATSVIQSKIEDLRLEMKATGAVSSGQDVSDNLRRNWVSYPNQPSVGLYTVVITIRWAHAPYNDARFLKYAAILGRD